MTWYKVTMTSAQAASGEQSRLQDKFRQLFIENMAPKDMALFCSGMDRDGFNIYFTPGCVSATKSLIEAYGGVECDEPAHEKELSLLVGNSEVWGKLIRHPYLPETQG